MLAIPPNMLDKSMKPNRAFLLIDDEPALARHLAQLASANGFDPVIARDHEHFRALFRRSPPVMIGIDLGMPGMDGVELLRFLAGEKAKAPILIVSGFDERVLESAYRLGQEMGLNMVGPLHKPVRAEDANLLLSQMHEQLAR